MFIGSLKRSPLSVQCALKWTGIVLFLTAAFASLPVWSQEGTFHKRTSTAGQSWLQEAQTLLAHGKLDESKAITQAQLERNPSSVEGYNLLGIICTAQKDFPSAQRAFEKALKLDPGAAKTHNNFGNMYAAQGKPGLAETQFRRALAQHPSDRDANYNLGSLLLAKGTAGKAIPYLERVRPADTQARFNLVRAYLEAGRVPEGLKVATQLSSEKKPDIQLHFTLGVLLASEKQYNAARLELEKADALQPQTFEILFNLGQTYLRIGELARAEVILNRALKLKPESAETLYLMAQVDQDDSRPVDALELLVRAHKLAPGNTDIIFLMARISMTQNYYEDAIPLLESGIKMAPQRADLRAALGESEFMAGKTEKALEEFQKLVELDSSARSYAFLGLAYRHLGRFDAARQAFQKGLTLDPHNASCLFNMGFIEERQGNAPKAEAYFQQTLRSNPNFSDALLELANLRTSQKKFPEAAGLLRRYIKLSHDPATGYYKLAMVERAMHDMPAAQRDLNVFQTLSKNVSTGPYPFQHLIDYLDNRSQLSSKQRQELDITELNAQIKKHPGQPQDLYLLAEAYLKVGQSDDALQIIAQLDAISSNDYRTQAGVGVLLARYRLYDHAIQHFQAALRANPDSDEVKFDLADAMFRKRLYPEALEAVQKISTAGQQDDTYLALLGDIYSHLGEAAKSSEIFRDAIKRNPDNDQYYLSLTLIQLRSGDIAAAAQILRKGLDRIPASGKLVWGMGLVSALEGKTPEAAERLERAVDLLPEWAGSYSTLGVFYYETGQIDKAREVLSRFKGSNAGGLDIDRIEDALSHAPTTSLAPSAPMPMVARQQLLQIALSIADRTL